MIQFLCLIQFSQQRCVQRLGTADCSLKQPEQKIPRSFSLPACTVAIGGSKSVEKSILQQRPLGATSLSAQPMQPGRAESAVLSSL